MDSSEHIATQTTYNLNNHWLSIDAQFQNVAVTVSLQLLPIKAANTLIMDNSEQIASQTTYLQDQKSLMLHWRSFSAWGCYRVTFSFAYKGCRYIDYG